VKVSVISLFSFFPGQRVAESPKNRIAALPRFAKSCWFYFFSPKGTLFPHLDNLFEGPLPHPLETRLLSLAGNHLAFFFVVVRIVFPSSNIRSLFPNPLSATLGKRLRGFPRSNHPFRVDRFAPSLSQSRSPPHPPPFKGHCAKASSDKPFFLPWEVLSTIKPPPSSFRRRRFGLFFRELGSLFLF